MDILHLRFAANQCFLRAARDSNPKRAEILTIKGQQFMLLADAAEGDLPHTAVTSDSEPDIPFDRDL